MKRQIEIRKKIGKKLKDVRRSRKLSLANVCNRMPDKMPKASLLNLENGGPAVQGIRLLYLMEYYGINIPSLLNGEKKQITNINRRLGKIDFDSEMVQLCEEIYELKQKTRTGIVRALNKFIRHLKENTDVVK